MIGGSGRALQLATQIPADPTFKGSVYFSLSPNTEVLKKNSHSKDHNDRGPNKYNIQIKKMLPTVI